MAAHWSRSNWFISPSPGTFYTKKPAKASLCKERYRYQLTLCSELWLTYLAELDVTSGCNSEQLPQHNDSWSCTEHVWGASLTSSCNQACFDPRNIIYLYLQCNWCEIQCSSGRLGWQVACDPCTWALIPTYASTAFITSIYMQTCTSIKQEWWQDVTS